MSRIQYFVHGRGRGHATRSLPIIDGLRGAGHDVEVFAGEDAAPVFAEDERCHAIRSLMPSQGVRLPSLLVARTLEASGSVRRGRAELVVSDGDLPGILAAHFAGLPSIAVGHAEIFSRCRRPSGVPRAPWMREAFRAWISAPKATSHVAVNFISLIPRERQTFVARPTVASIPRSERCDAGRVVCYFRDDNGDHIVRTLVNRGYRPVLFSGRGSNLQGVENRPLSRDGFLSSMATAAVVVASAGSQLISECVFNDISIYALFKEDDDEQRINVSMLRTTSSGDGSSFSRFSERRLIAFIENAETRGQGDRRAETLSEDVVTVVLREAQTLLERL